MVCMVCMWIAAASASAVAELAFTGAAGTCTLHSTDGTALDSSCCLSSCGVSVSVLKEENEHLKSRLTVAHTSRSNHA